MIKVYIALFIIIIRYFLTLPVGKFSWVFSPHPAWKLCSVMWLQFPSGNKYPVPLFAPARKLPTCLQYVDTRRGLGNRHLSVSFCIAYQPWSVRRSDFFPAQQIRPTSLKTSVPPLRLYWLTGPPCRADEAQHRACPRLWFETDNPKRPGIAGQVSEKDYA